MSTECDENPWRWLQDWIAERTRGYWEVGGSVSFASNALPMWGFTFDLRGRLKPGGVHGEPVDLSFGEVEEKASEERWVRCWVEEGEIQLLTSLDSAPDALAGMRSWIEGGCVGSPRFQFPDEGQEAKTSEVDWLLAWAAEHSDNEDGDCYGIVVQSLPHPGWSLRVGLEEFGLDQQEMPEFFEGRSRDDWVQGRVRSEMFDGTCGPGQLEDLVRRFRLWIEEGE